MFPDSLSKLRKRSRRGHELLGRCLRSLNPQWLHIPTSWPRSELGVCVCECVFVFCVDGKPHGPPLTYPFPGSASHLNSKYFQIRRDPQLWQPFAQPRPSCQGGSGCASREKRLFPWISFPHQEVFFLNKEQCMKARRS